MRLPVLLLLVAQFSAPVQSLATTPSLLISPLLQLGMCRNFVLDAEYVPELSSFMIMCRPSPWFHASEGARIGHGAPATSTQEIASIYFHGCIIYTHEYS